MLSAFKKLFDRFNSNEIFRYLVAGGLTTLVNLVVFTVLRYGVKLSLTLSNFIAIVLAILFAFFINKYYAFKTPAKKKSEVLTEFVKFIGGRLFSMIIEIVGVYILAVWAGLPDMVAKIITQFIVVIVNYVISKLFVFKKDGVKRTFFEWMKDNLLYELAFILPAILFIAICIMTHVAPFGTTTLMLVDSLHQYLPFYSDYYDKLKESGEFLYSWNGGMGYNYVTLWSYYLSSPFLLLILFFPKTMINTAMTLVIGLKICSCSLSLCYAIDKIYDTKKDLKILCFGLAYAFSNYVIGYYWNNMWLDVLIMAPLVLLGVKKLIDDANPKFYIITLFLALFGNFYIGFMLCIFLVFWFLIYPHKSVKDFFKSGVRFAISSLISAGMAAFMLLPTFQGLMNTSPAKSEMPKFTWYGEWETLYKKFAIYVGAFNNDNNDGELNIYCSLMALFMGMLFLAVKEVSIWQKIKRFLLLAFIYISFNNQLLNYIWHGFHDQFGIPNRFAFLFILLLLISGYEGLQYYQTTGFFRFFIPLVLIVAFTVVQGSPVDGWLFFDEQAFIVKWIYIFYIGYYMLFMLNIMLEWKPIVFTIAFVILGCAEISSNAIHIFLENGELDYTAYYTNKENVWAAADSVDDGTWYREELSKNRVVDENFWFNLKSVGVFGSTANGDSVTFLNRLGFYTATNEHLYNGATPITDSLLGVKYIYFRDGDYFDHRFKFKKRVKNVDIYENEYPLSVGYMVNPLDKWEWDQYQPTDALNAFCNTATDEKGTLFELLPDDYGYSGENCTVEPYGLGEGTYSYKMDEDAVDMSVTLTLKAKDDRPIYVRATGTDLEDVDLYVNDEVTATGRNFFHMAYVGDTKKGDTVSVTFSFNGAQAAEQTVNLVAYAYDDDYYHKVYNSLAKNQLNVTSYDSNTINGNIDVDKDGLMMTSVVYEPGFKVYVDGKEAKITKIGNSFIGVNLSAGSHKIKIEFVPELLPYGIGVSILSVFFFWAYVNVDFSNLRFRIFKKREESVEEGGR